METSGLESQRSQKLKTKSNHKTLREFYTKTSRILQLDTFLQKTNLNYEKLDFTRWSFEFLGVRDAKGGDLSLRGSEAPDEDSSDRSGSDGDAAPAGGGTPDGGGVGVNGARRVGNPARRYLDIVR